MCKKKTPGKPVREEGPKEDFKYGRANSNFESRVWYKVAPNIFDRSYGVPIQDQKKRLPHRCAMASTSDTLVRFTTLIGHWHCLWYDQSKSGILV